jgi:2',3'-cyclic-nucleotide 2'-phosphodiesterase (5'-nucleotidase family)
VRLTILHTNDLHGREDRIAQIATLVKRERAMSDHRVLYLDAGDVEETTNRLSNLTKGVAMHRLLAHTTCEATAVGNACWLRYGPQSVSAHAAVSPYPHVLANFTGVDGVAPSVLLEDVGIVGLTSPFDVFSDEVDWGFERVDALEAARAAAHELREQGAALVVLLSHLGLESPEERWDDRRIAPELEGVVDIVIGAHTHDLLPEGEWIGNVLVVQAGAFGEHLGRIEIDGESIVARVEVVPDDTEHDPAIAIEAAAIEREVEAMLGQELGTIAVPLNARFIAEVLRARLNADVGLFTVGMTLTVVPPGVVTRGALYEASESGANPQVTTMTGAQLSDLIARGRDPEFMAETPRAMRGRERGYLEVVGVEPAELEPERHYVVAGTDWELSPYGGYALAEWGLESRSDFPVIVREAVEEHLQR